MWRQAGSRELNGLMIRFAEDILQVGSEIYVRVRGLQRVLQSVLQPAGSVCSAARDGADTVWSLVTRQPAIREHTAHRSQNIVTHRHGASGEQGEIIKVYFFNDIIHQQQSLQS